MYKKEDLKFYNMKSNVSYGNTKIYNIENELSFEEKIAFIDEVKNGIASYLYNILTKWEKEKDSLPKDKWENVKTVSKKAWIKKNDPRKIINNIYDYGSYSLFGTKYKLMSTTCPDSEFGKTLPYTGNNVVHQWYHDLCINLQNEEARYLKEIDPFQIKVSKVKDFGERYHILFNNKKINDIVWNNRADITDEELDIVIAAYEKIDNYVNQITKEVNSKIEGEYKEEDEE